MIDGLDIKELYCFVVVADKLHFGDAAKQLNMTQPSLSRILQRIESKLGYKVLDRSTRRVEVTPEGLLLLKEARVLLDQVQRIRLVGQLARRNSRKQLSISCVASASSVMANILEKFSHAHPQANIQLRFSTTAQQIRLMLDGDIHIAFLRPVSGQGGLHEIIVKQLPVAARDPMLKVGGFHTLMVADEFLAVAMPASDPLATREQIDVSDLAGANIIKYVSPPLDPVYQDKIDELFREANVGYSEGPEAADTVSALTLAAAGLGIAFVPESVRSMEMPGVKILPLNKNVLSVPLICVWSKLNRAEQLLVFVRFLERMFNTTIDSSGDHLTSAR